jgi:hypothetical protein
MTDHITEYSDRSLTYEKDTLEGYYSEAGFSSGL